LLNQNENIIKACVLSVSMRSQKNVVHGIKL